MPKIPPEKIEHSYQLFNESCFETFKRIPDKSIDLVLCDPPYGTTQCKWDSIIPLEPMWRELKRVCKLSGAIILSSCQPFTTMLIASNLSAFKYDWIWDKKFAGNFVNARLTPLRNHEHLSVFGSRQTTPDYFPQMTQRDTPIKSGGNGQNPTKAILMKAKPPLNKTYTEKFPTTIISFNCREGRGLHPTQKPVALMEYLIKTYTNENDLVLDFAMGSGTTGVACGNLNRRFIGCDNDTEHGYFGIAEKRIREAYEKRKP